MLFGLNSGKTGAEAVSELVAAILLISLVIIGVAMVAAVFFSQSGPVAVPQVQTLAGINPSEGTFYLYNNGGDSLKTGTYTVLVDSGSGYEDKTSDFTLSSGGDVWSVGTALVYDYGSGNPPERVNIVYTGEGIETLISSTPLTAFVNESLWGGIIDEGEVETPPSDGIGIVVIENEEDIALGLEDRGGEATVIASVNLTFVADRVDAAFYNYDNLGDDRNGLIRNMVLNTSLGPNMYEVPFDELVRITSASELPIRISLTVIAYDNNTVIGTDTFLFWVRS